MIQLNFVHCGYFKLDGGAMFGIVPKQLWKRLNPADENNMCTWALRCLLIETDERKILVDTGLGSKQGERFRKHFEPHGEENLYKSLKQIMIHPADITDVICTHFHFDHCGGAVSLENETSIPTFPNARYWTTRRHYNWALEPNIKEKASFLKENFVPLDQSGVLNFIEEVPDRFAWDETISFCKGIDLLHCYGHTEAMTVVRINTGERTLIYCADLMPSSFHLGMPYVMSYDIRPLITLQEKNLLLTKCMEENAVLLFEHDPVNGAGHLDFNERGKVHLSKVYNDLSTFSV